MPSISIGGYPLFDKTMYLQLEIPGLYSSLVDDEDLFYERLYVEYLDSRYQDPDW
jgi:hypothetical protein